MARHQAQDQDRGAPSKIASGGGEPLGNQLQDNGQGAADNGHSKGDADSVAFDVLGGHGAHLGPDRRAAPA